MSWLSRDVRNACAVIACAAITVVAVQAAHVDLSNGTRVEGTDIRARSDGTIILTTPQGQVTYMRGQYIRAVADKPADFDRARQLAAQKKFDEAIALLNSIIQSYRFLDWDNQARIALAQVQSAKGDPAAAADTFDQLFRANPDSKKDSAILGAYHQALLDSKQFPKLEPELDALAAKGSRADAARAQVMRGDIKLSQGQLEGAALDYLRSAILFESEKAVLPEALFKAAETLEKMRDPRAKDLFRRVAQEFPGSPFAQRAAGK